MGAGGKCPTSDIHYKHRNLQARQVLPELPINCSGLSNQRTGWESPPLPWGTAGHEGQETLPAREITASTLTPVSPVNNSAGKHHSDKDDFFL